MECSSGEKTNNPAQEHSSPGDVGQHRIVSREPFKCLCEKQFTRLHTLKRHIQGTQKHLPVYPCSECAAYQGQHGFKRKDHLVQHLRSFHKYGHDELPTVFAPRNARRLNIPVCHFESCEYYRDPTFKDLPIGQQESNRPFDTQSDYTRHMKVEHDWSPYPCRAPFCAKYDGKGFFNYTALEKHCKEKHPGSTIPAPTARKEPVKAVTCDYCAKSLQPGTLRSHHKFYCKGKVTCSYCPERMESRQLRDHERRSCKGEVACRHCHKRMESRQLCDHEYIICEGEINCPQCYKLVERRQLYGWSRGRCNDCLE
ncbi:hypothetical protein F5B18DRAFT_615217 [Nemania serpens]|nr:hypothetical protein F5B18DRAFT_615217 [Nemania serpens]